MNKTIKALSALIKNYTEDSSGLSEELTQLFDNQDHFLDQVTAFDKLFAKNPEFEGIKEFAFDLLIAQHLEENSGEEDYFETHEWLDIEDKTIERGTELLNMILYITEARDNDVEIELGDFLNEFLLVDDDEFQDEHKIYESLISNQDLVEEDATGIVSACREIKADEEMKDLLLPVFLFFRDPDRQQPGLILDQMTQLERAIYLCLMEFSR